MYGKESFWDIRGCNMFCRFCGKKIPDDSIFCMNCGACLSEVSSEKEQKVMGTQNVCDFDDEILPIPQPYTNRLKISKPEKREDQESLVYTKESLDIQKPFEDKERVMLENPSGNFWTHLSEKIIYDVNVNAKLYSSDGIDVYETNYGNKTSRSRILSGHNIDSFYICEEWATIVFREFTKGGHGKGSLWACDLEGNDLCQIVGGNDSALYYTVTDQWIFVVVENKKGDKFLYQISSDLKSAEVIKKKIDNRQPIAANDRYLYYTIFDDPNHMKLMQYDIKKKRDKVLLRDVGISAFQIYDDEIIVSTYQDCMFLHRRGEELIAISEDGQSKRVLAKAYTKEIICYLDQIFYIDLDTDHVFVLPLAGGNPRKIYARSSVKLNLMPYGAGITLIDTQREERIHLSFGKEIEYILPLPIVSNNKKQKKSIDEVENNLTEIKTIEEQKVVEQKIELQETQEQSTSESNLAEQCPSKPEEEFQQKEDEISSEEMKRKKVEFKKQNDECWIKHIGRLIIYNIVKILFMLLCAQGVVLIMDESMFLGIVELFAGTIICTFIRNKMRPKEAKDLEKQYNILPATPPGIRGIIFLVLFIIFLAVFIGYRIEA